MSAIKGFLVKRHPKSFSSTDLPEHLVKIESFYNAQMNKIQKDYPYMRTTYRITKISKIVKAAILNKEFTQENYNTWARFESNSWKWR
jgi:hypothetical protein